MEPSLTEINDHFTMLVNLLPSNLCINQEEYYKLKKKDRNKKNTTVMEKATESKPKDEDEEEVGDPKERLHKLLDDFKAKRNLKGSNPRPEKPAKKRPADKALHKAAERLPSAPPPSGKPAAPKALYNAPGRTIFSKFDFMHPLDKAAEGGSGGRKGSKKQKSLAADLQGPKNPRQAIAQLERRQQQLQELQETAPEKADAMRQKMAWTTALLRSQGAKVKDDVTRLRKSAKREQKNKERSREKWKAREETVAKNKAKKQEKRAQNLKSRRDAKFSNKIKKLKKQGRILPEMNNS